MSSSQHPGTPSYATAELTWGLILSAFRQIPAADGLAQGRQLADRRRLDPAQQDARHFRLWPHRRRGRELRPRLRHECRGLGAAAIRWFAPRPKAISSAPSKIAFFERCDVLSLHMRLVDATRGIVTADDLRRMKPTALIVNTSRAQLIERGALVEALRAGRPGHGRGRRLRGRAAARHHASAARTCRTSSARRTSATSRATNTSCSSPTSSIRSRPTRPAIRSTS